VWQWNGCSTIILINNDNRVNLTDAIIALSIVTGAGARDLSPEADVNGDEKIGLEEVLYILENIE
jgi:hypothetical protein